MSEHNSGLKVTASDALEFEPVAPKLKRAGNALKTALFVVLAVSGGATGWAFYGDRIVAIIGDAGSDVPIVRAELGPIKVRPATPGGLQVPDRDKLVYNRMRSSGADQGTAPSVERLLPMPEKPITQRTNTSAQVKSAEGLGSAASASGDEKIAGNLPVPPVKPKRINETPRVADVASAVKPKLAPPAPPVPVVSKLASTVPKVLRPKSSQTASAASKSPKVSRSAAKPAASTSSQAVSKSSYRVQLAAARTPTAARGEWDKLRRKHLDLLGDLGLSVTKVDLGGTKGVFYRLRVGPLKDRPLAKALCKKLAKRKVSCLVVRPGK